MRLPPKSIGAAGIFAVTFLAMAMPLFAQLTTVAPASAPTPAARPSPALRDRVLELVKSSGARLKTVLSDVSKPGFIRVNLVHR